MIEIRECCGTNVYVFKNILSQAQCDFFIKEFYGINELQIIKEMPEVSDKLWGFIGDTLKDIEFYDKKRERNFNIISLKQYVSISKATFGVGRHKDEQFGGDVFKMFFYLNKLSVDGGTYFYENEGEDKITIQNETGNGALFDIDLEHSSESFPRGEIKHVIGVRPNIKYAS